MNQPSTLPLPLSRNARRLLAAEAKANGLTAVEQFARHVENGFGVSLPHAIECLLADARSAAQHAAATLTLPNKPNANLATPYTKAGHHRSGVKAA